MHPLVIMWAHPILKSSKTDFSIGYLVSNFYNKQAGTPAPAPLTISLFYSILLHRKPFLPDHLHHLIHILRAQLITLCLNHHTNHQLRTALTSLKSLLMTAQKNISLPTFLIRSSHRQCFRNFIFIAGRWNPNIKS